MALSGMPGSRNRRCCSRGLQNILVLGLGFFLVMGGYSPCQSFASSLLNFKCLPVGEISIGVIYLFLAAGSLVAPSVVGRYGPRRCMWISSLAYGTYAASVSYIALPIIAVTSAAIGFFGAFLNISSGVALADWSDSGNRGLYSGIFNAFNQGSAIPGNVLAIVLVGNSSSSGPRPCGHTVEATLVPGWSPDDSPLFLGCAALCFLGTATLTLYQSPPAPALSGPRLEIGLVKPLLRVVRICGAVDGVLYLTPLLLYSGVSNAFWSGMFTRQMHPDLVGSSMLILGGAEVLGGPLIGKTLDRFGRGASVLLLLSIQVAGFYTAHLGNRSQNKMMLWIAAGLLGMGDSGVATLCYAGLALRFGADDQHEEGPAPAPAVGSIQADSEKAALLPKPSSPDGEADRGFNSGDAYSAMYLLQSIAIGLLFALMPMFAQKNGVSTDRQFFWEEAGCLFVAIIANVGFVVDGFRSRTTAKSV